MLKIGLVGYSGRMGQLIFREIAQKEEMQLISIYTKKSQHSSCVDEALVTSDWQEFLEPCDMVIDFSSPQGTSQLLRAVAKNPKPLVIGTTGLSEETHVLMQELSQTIPIVYATNTSQGVALLNRLVFIASEVLRDADIEIVEMHHHHKKDAPSGTAMTLAQYCANARGLDLEKVRVSGRDGNVGERSKDEIGVMSLRGGDIVGKHTVGFYCDGEYLEITHNATNRKTFALGALRAAQWIVSKQSGLYSMKDVLR